MTPRTVLVLSVLAAACAAASPARAASSYDSCAYFIDSLPAVIATQGTHCLRKDLATSMASGHAIAVTTNNVTIDCNGFKLGGLGAGAGTQAVGIYTDGRSNLTVRDCKIRGFSQAVRVDGATAAGTLIEDNLIEGTTRIPLVLLGDASMVRRNRILDTGGSTVVTHEAIGIYAAEADIVDNLIAGISATDVTNQASVYGVLISAGNTAHIRGNVVRGLTYTGEGESWGIAVGAGSDVVDNFVSGPVDNGISCSSLTSIATENRIVGATVLPVFGCTERDNVIPD